MAAKLVSMKITPAELKKRREPTTLAEGDAPAYPYGLTISLDDDALTKLGIGDDLPESETEMVLIAKVEVTNVSSSDSAGGGKRRSISLQITEMCLEEDVDDLAAAAKTLYNEE